MLTPTVDFQFGTAVDIRTNGFARCRRVEIIRRGVPKWNRYEAVAMLVKRTEKDQWELHIGATHPSEVGPASDADHVEPNLRDMYGPVSEVI